MDSLNHSFFFGVDFSPVHKTRKFSAVRGHTSDRSVISDKRDLKTSENVQMDKRAPNLSDRQVYQQLLYRKIQLGLATFGCCRS